MNIIIKIYKKVFWKVFAIIFIVVTIIVGKIVFDSVYPAFTGGYKPSLIFPKLNLSKNRNFVESLAQKDGVSNLKKKAKKF